MFTAIVAIQVAILLERPSMGGIVGSTILIMSIGGSLTWGMSGLSSGYVAAVLMTTGTVVTGAVVSGGVVGLVAPLMSIFTFLTMIVSIGYW